MFLHGVETGSLRTLGPGRYRFAYGEGVVATHDRGDIVLSASLPIKDEEFQSQRTKPFFEGLLPEGQVRRTIARSLGVSEDNGYGMLAELGAECAGAVVIVPGGSRPRSPAEWTVEWLADDELAQKIEDLPRYPLGVRADDEVRLSLGGVQEKLLLTRAPDGRLGQPKNGAPSTHILKPGRGEYPDIVANEAFCLLVAHFVGLPVPKVEVIDVAGSPCLLVERFDRHVTDDGGIERVHQEDTCQALRRLPSEKYESEGGPSIAEIINLLRDIGGSTTARDIRGLLMVTVLNLLLGNCDAHGKNYALLHEPKKGISLAPFYDIVSTNVYPQLTDKLAMTVGGTSKPEEITARSWAKLAEESGLGRQLLSQVEGNIRLIVKTVDAALFMASEMGWYRPVLEEIIALCKKRALALTR